MTPERRKRSAVALAVVLSITGAVLAHLAVIDGLSPTVGALLSLLPAAALASWALRRPRYRKAGIAALFIVSLALVSAWWALEQHFRSVLFVEHAGANLALAVLFGRTLLGGREALCTRLARLLHGHLPPEVVRYTRQVTVAWTVLFVTLFMASAALYLGNFVTEWSILANILSPLLVALMFLVEYAIRLRALPEWERTGILGAFRAFSRHFEAARFEAPR